MFALCLFQNGVWPKWFQTRQAVSIPAHILDDGAWKARQPYDRIFERNSLVSTRRFSINRNFSAITGNPIKELIINSVRDLGLTMDNCRGQSYDRNKFPLRALTPKRPRQGLVMGRSEPGGEKERELGEMATKVIAAGRRVGRRAFDWRTFNEKRLNQARTFLFIQNLCETEHAGDYERVGIFILESSKDLGRLYEMVPVRIVINSNWEPSLPNVPGKDKLWEEASPTAATPES